MLAVGGGLLWQYNRQPASAATSSTRQPTAARSTAAPKSIAVLPFVNLSSDKDQEYFSDGISESLLNLLTRIPQLKVTARTSSFYFKGKNVAIPEIAQRLHVAHVLVGSVQKAGDEVRITVQLVDAATDTQRWSQSYDRKIDDVFRIQDEIADKVVKALKVKLLGATPTTHPTDPRAYALYLQGRELGRQFTAEALRKSDTLLHQALAIDPNYAPAWVDLSVNYGNEPLVGLLSTRESFSRAREAALKALAIDPDYAPAHARLGRVAMYGDGDLADAAQHLQRALQLDPNDLNVLGETGTLLANLGRLEESLAVEQALVRRDPVNPVSLSKLGYVQIFAGRYDEAIESYRTVLSLSPGRGGAHVQLGVALMLKGDAQAALAEISQESSGIMRRFGLPLVYCALGRQADADALIEAMVTKHAHENAYNIAYNYAFCGKADKAFEWLNQAVEYGDSGLAEIVPENLFDRIHADPRWQSFLRKLGRAPDQLARITLQVGLPERRDTDAEFASGTPDATGPAGRKKQ
ncbi:MAG: tetratricopeptide repeat protein [Rhodanobacteraceae bacterium]